MVTLWPISLIWTLKTINTFLTAGSQDGLSKAVEMMMGVKDHVILEEPAYGGVLSIVG